MTGGDDGPNSSLYSSRLADRRQTCRQVRRQNGRSFATANSRRDAELV